MADRPVPAIGCGDGAAALARLLERSVGAAGQRRGLAQRGPRRRPLGGDPLGGWTAGFLTVRRTDDGDEEVLAGAHWDRAVRQVGTHPFGPSSGSIFLAFLKSAAGPSMVGSGKPREGWWL